MKPQQTQLIAPLWFASVEINRYPLLRITAHVNVVIRALHDALEVADKTSSQPFDQIEIAVRRA
jgi:hypothetical protein